MPARPSERANDRQVIFCVLYAVIFAGGIAGNVLVCVAVIKGKQLHSVTNFFIMNLAVSGMTAAGLLFSLFLPHATGTGWGKQFHLLLVFILLLSGADLA